MSDEPIYFASQSHPLKDIPLLRSLGYAIPGDGDRFTKETKGTETK